MTTKSDKPVTRETTSYVREKGYRALIATIHGSMLELRPKGLGAKRTETLEFASLWQQAVKARVLQAKLDRKKRKK